MRNKEELRAILALAEIKKSNLSDEEKISYMKLTNFIKGSNNWCPVNDHIPATVYVDILLKDIFDFLYKPNLLPTQIEDYLADFNKKLFISVVLKRVTSQHKASRIAAKIKNANELKAKEIDLLNQALTDFLNNINCIIDHIDGN